MKIINSAIPEVMVAEPMVYRDGRGFFMELFQADRYRINGISRHFVQDNLSRSSKGVLRGLHFQSPKSQGKLVTVVAGAVLDVAVDVRVGSPTFGRYVAFELTEDNRRQCWVPRGFAHGFIVLSDTADLLYKCDEFYSPEDEVVLRWDDPDLGIKWPCKAPIVSARDQKGLRLADLRSRLPQYEAA